ncbi:MAG: hypothetical protein AAFY98_03745 [Verrucomicrobiota bacterium]
MMNPSISSNLTEPKKKGGFSVATMGAFGVSAVIHILVFLMVGTVVVFEGPLLTEFFDSEDIVVSSNESPLDDTPVLLEEPEIMPDSPVIPDVNVTPSNEPAAMNTMDLIVANAPATSASFAIPKSIGTGTNLIVSKSKGDSEGVGGVAAKIFGKSIEAKRLGVILDVSASTHKVISNVIKEIQKAFPDAILVFTPGCTLNPTQGEITPLSDYDKVANKYRPKVAVKQQYHLTSFISKLNKKNPAFKELWKDAEKDNLGYVAFIPLTQAKKGEKLVVLGGVSQAIDHLVENQVDTIYWFADYEDSISANQLAITSKLLRQKKVRLYMHDFLAPLGSKGKKGANTVNSLKKLADQSSGEVFLKTL